MLSCLDRRSTGPHTIRLRRASGKNQRYIASQSHRQMMRLFIAALENYGRSQYQLATITEIIRGRQPSELRAYIT